MKYLKINCILMLNLSITFFAMNGYAGIPTIQEIPVEAIFSPRGYDSLDSSELVVKGALPNACHKNPKVEVTRISDTFEIKLTSLFYDPSNPFCPEVIVPFIKTIDLGQLDAGEYKVKYMNVNGVDEIIEYKVSEPRLGNDKNEIYANVEHIELRLEQGKVILHGHNPSDCFVLKNVRVIDNGRKTVSILPRMEQIRDFCPMKMVAFQIEVDLPEVDSSEKILLHVRSMKGDSVNTIY